MSQAQTYIWAQLNKPISNIIMYLWIALLVWGSVKYIIYNIICLYIMYTCIYKNIFK